jgi:N-acetylmuramoyl-L-alanine amidase
MRMMRMAVLVLGLLMAIGSGAAFAKSDSVIYIGDQSIELSQPLWEADGVTYAPVKELANRMSWQVSYDSDSGQITVSNAYDDTLIFRTGASSVVFDGTMYDIAETAKLHNDSAYFPLRVLAEAMHANVGWQSDEKALTVQAEEPYAVQGGDTLKGIAVAHGTSAEALMKRNGLAGDALEAGQLLKVIVPEFLDPATADAALLAKIVQVEAGDEPYEGKLAVANVVLNRVHSGAFPDTVKDVIYAPGQFPPSRNGHLQEVSASADCLRAANAALSGENNVPGALYFFNPKWEPNKVKKAKLVKKIGTHMFSR